MATPRHTSATVKGTLPVPIRPRGTREYREPEDVSIARLMAWREAFEADRRRRGIPKDGLHLPVGVRTLEMIERAKDGA